MPASRESPDSRERILAFRFESQNLAARLPSGAFLSAAGACGLQNTPPGSAALSLHARVEGLTLEAVDRALAQDKTLLQTWSLRGAPHLFPTAEAAVFTQGLLPEDEESQLFFIFGVQQALNRIEMGIGEVIERADAALREVLDQRVLTRKRQLDVELASQVASGLPPRQLAAWQSPSLYGEGQLLGEAVVSFTLRLLALQGLVCFAPRQGSQAAFVLTEQWLGAPLPRMDEQQARTELVRRYLGCYGPSTVQHFAEWAGISPTQAERAWKLIEPELAEVNLEGQTAFLLQSDRDRFLSSTLPKGIRFLPPHDPFLQMRDKPILLPEKALQRRVWRATGGPGVVLVDGRLAGIWHPNKKGARLKLLVEEFAPSSPDTRARVEAEAVSLAPFKGCTSVVVEFQPAA